SSDLLARFGIDLTMPPQSAAACLEQLGLCFLFAPHYHAGVKHAVPVRQQLKTRTLFNILGPLINPASPDFMLLGVYSQSLLMPIAQTLKALGVKRAMVVHGSGLDEIALHGDTSVVELKDGALKEYTLTPADFGVQGATIAELEGGEPEQNAEITRAILQGHGLPAHRDAVAINTGAALYLSGLAPCLKTGTAQALTILESGKGWTLLQQLADVGGQEQRQSDAQEKQA
ncbi:MAG: anthranilate phosphoribosyltransferase, partial [Shewanella sp.]|nr:anthranilate phosphoribosyltransferase [Shewanella sp.]